jgi:hypothetical protein
MLMNYVKIKLHLIWKDTWPTLKKFNMENKSLKIEDILP